MDGTANGWRVICPTCGKTARYGRIIQVSGKPMCGPCAKKANGRLK